MLADRSVSRKFAAFSPERRTMRGQKGARVRAGISELNLRTF